VSAYIAGVTAPPGKKMGHAGAIVSGGKGTAQAKIDALTAAGALVGRNPTEAGELMATLVAALA
jgi:succinyl-CoA synthetase alpha subunit